MALWHYVCLQQDFTDAPRKGNTGGTASAGSILGFDAAFLGGTA